jgi:hypothetical protein
MLRCAAAASPDLVERVICQVDADVDHRGRSAHQALLRQLAL